jgi:hypothetical protein
LQGITFVVILASDTIEVRFPPLRRRSRSLPLTPATTEEAPTDAPGRAA